MFAYKFKIPTCALFTGNQLEFSPFCSLKLPSNVSAISWNVNETKKNVWKNCERIIQQRERKNELAAFSERIVMSICFNGQIHGKINRNGNKNSIQMETSADYAEQVYSRKMILFFFFSLIHPWQFAFETGKVTMLLEGKK